MASDSVDVESEGPNLIQAKHDEAFMYISQGISYEEQNQLSLAREMYLKGLEKIDTALNVRCDRPYCVGSKWDKARSLQQKMRKNLQVVKTQLEKISLVYQNEIKLPSNEFTELPPSYDEACEHNLSLTRRSSCPDTSLESSNGYHEDSPDARESEVSDIFHIPSGVQLFFVSAQGLVTTPSSSSSLHVYKFNDENKAVERSLPSAWLQVGDWRYPLLPGQSPALESGYGAFIFPDVASEQDTASVGLILPAEIDFETRREFETVLASLTALLEESETGDYTYTSSGSFSDSLSRGLVTGAEYLSIGLVKGATFAGNCVHKGAAKLKERLQPEETPATIDPRVREGLKVAKTASHTALRVSGFLVNKLGELTVALGNKVAPYVREQSTKLLTNTFKSDPQKAKSTVDGVVKVAAGGLQGFSAVYMGLENAARILAYSLSTETVNVVGHKYGSEAQEVVGNALFSVGNLALTTRNVQTLGVKGIAKKTAKDTGKAVLKDYAEHVDKPGSSSGEKSS